jgi:hypothetical protein
LTHKYELSGNVIGLIRELIKDKNLGRLLRLDNAYENYALKKAFKDENFFIKFDYSRPQTPQRDGNVERKFLTLHVRIRAM